MDSIIQHNQRRLAIQLGNDNNARFLREAQSIQAAWAFQQSAAR